MADKFGAGRQRLQTGVLVHNKGVAVCASMRQQRIFPVSPLTVLPSPLFLNRSAMPCTWQQRRQQQQAAGAASAALTTSSSQVRGGDLVSICTVAPLSQFPGPLAGWLNAHSPCVRRSLASASPFTPVSTPLTHLALLFPSAGGAGAVVPLSSPIVSSKAIKNPAELEGMKEAHLRDAVAICDFLLWLENKVHTATTEGAGIYVCGGWGGKPCRAEQWEDSEMHLKKQTRTCQVTGVS